MAKCGCAGSTCACKVAGSGGISVTGTGTAQDPYVIGLGEIDIDGFVEVDDTPTVALTLVGDGTSSDPLVLTANVTPGATVFTTPTTSGTTVIDAGTRTHVLDHGATIASHTLTLPSSSTALEREVKILNLSPVTALTVNGASGVTVAGAPSALSAGQFFRMQLIGTVWRRVG